MSLWNDIIFNKMANDVNVCVILNDFDNLDKPKEVQFEPEWVLTVFDDQINFIS